MKGLMFRCYLLVSVFLSLLLCQQVVVAQSTATQFQITIDSVAHQKFGLFYPVTYVFQLPSGSNGLTAYYRYRNTDAWLALTTRTAADQFSGVSAARFDYDNSVAFVSVAFSSASDSVYVRIAQGQTDVAVEYLGFTKYYDNRRAAVTVSLDDWNYGNGSYFNTALTVLNNAKIPSTVGVLTYGLPDWNQIQQWYNSGAIEVASHSRNHPCDQSEYLINGYAFQIQGSRDDILSRLNLANPYVTTYLEPCGYTDASLRSAVVAAGYLAERGYPSPTSQSTFSGWAGDGAYSRSLYSIDTTPWYDGTNTHPEELLQQTNDKFDEAYASGGIYHLVDHPWYDFWTGNYLPQHITHIANRADVWYVPFGYMYLYHFVTERGLLRVYADGSTTPLTNNLITNPPPPPAPHQITTWPKNKSGAVSITFNFGTWSQITGFLPVLDGAGARGTFYLITNNNDYDQTWPAWRTAAANGHEIASQTASYTNLTTATATRRTAELANSKATIESQVPSQQCLSLSYPFGATDTTVQAAAAAYYISARTMYSDAPNYKPFDFFNLKAVGGYPPGHDVAYMSGLTSTAESKGGWLIFHLNEETDAGSWTAAMLNQYLTSLQTKNVWVGTVGSTVKFIRERDSATLSVVSSNSGQIVLSLTDTMDNTVYDQPLTIRSEVPSAWAYVSVMQGARTQFATPVIEDGRSIVYYDAVPDAGPITLVPAVPSITSLSPSSALAGGSAFTLTVNGGGFISGATVRWNGSDRTTTFVSNAQVQASISAADVTIPGAASVTVRES